MSLYARRGGDPDRPALVLLHGLGATSAVWSGLIDRLGSEWAWLAPDLPGHGMSSALSGYSIDGLAAAVAETLDRTRPAVVLGHSLGGAVGLALAGGSFGVTVRAVGGLGIKVRWSEADLARSSALAGKPNRVFSDRSEAVDRALKVAGLTGLVEPESGTADAGVVEVDGGWTLRFDPVAFGVGAPDMRALLAAARAEVTLAAGENDPMSPVEHLEELPAEVIILPGLGHNAHVEAPAALTPLLDRLRAAVER